MQTTVKNWIEAARPKTLSAGLVPVLVGSAAAAHYGHFSWPIFLACLIGSLSIQVATNYINDGSDFLRGADTHERIGPKRMAASGVFSPKALFTAAGIFLFIACLTGLYLVQAAGLPILLVGIASIICAIAYTAGPFPLAYYGLGDIFVFLFFGLAAVGGTFFAHEKNINAAILLTAAIVGLHGIAILIVNNTRDVPTDSKTKKRTLSVRMGQKTSRYYFCIVLLLSFLLLAPLSLQLGAKFLLPFLALPLALRNAWLMLYADTALEFNSLLAETAKLQLVIGLLLSISFLWV